MHLEHLGKTCLLLCSLILELERHWLPSEVSLLLWSTPSLLQMRILRSSPHHLPGNCSWSTQVLPHCKPLQYCVPRSPGHWLPIHRGCFRHAASLTRRGGHRFLRLDKSLWQHVHRDKPEVALVRNSLNLVDCHGMLRAWLEQHFPWGSRTVIKAVMGWGNSIRFL